MGRVRTAVVELGKYLLVFLAALSLPALVAGESTAAAGLFLLVGLVVAGAYGRRVRRRIGF